MAQYEVSCHFLCFLKDLVLLLPFFIHIKLSVSEIAPCAFYYARDHIADVHAFIMKKYCVLYCDWASRRRSNLIEIATQGASKVTIFPKFPKWYSIGI